jgi:hypothetical protein
MAPVRQHRADKIMNLGAKQISKNGNNILCSVPQKLLDLAARDPNVEIGISALSQFLDKS